MPKLVDYAVRFDFLRQAAFEVVLRHGDGGLGALSRRSIAAALGTSVNTVRRLLADEAELAGLAAAHVRDRRRWGRWARVRDVEPGEAALSLLRTCLADSEERVAEELVWLRLVLATAAPPIDRDRDGLVLHERFAIYERGYLDDEEPTRTPAATPRSSVLVEDVADRDAVMAAVVADALDVLECPPEERPHRTQELRALLAGLTSRVCLGEITPPDAVAVLARTVQRWAPVRVTE